MTNGMVSAPQPEAVETGVDILGSGGNVVDAAIGAALVQTVVDQSAFQHRSRACMVSSLLMDSAVIEKG